MRYIGLFFFPIAIWIVGNIYLAPCAWINIKVCDLVADVLKIEQKYKCKYLGNKYLLISKKKQFLNDDDLIMCVG